MDRFLSSLYAVTLFANVSSGACFLSMLFTSGNPLDIPAYTPILAALFSTVALISSATTWAMTRKFG